MIGMTEKEVFDFLADNEERLFYASRYNRESEAIKAAHDAYRKALVEFSKATGITNE